MNSCFKSILNRRTGSWQVVSENSLNAGKTGNSVSKVVVATVLGLSAGAALAALPSSIDNGTETVDGATENVGGDLSIGIAHTGSLNIVRGGKVTNSIGFIASDQGSNGTVSVTGPGSVWENSYSLLVANHGTGTVNITNGGKVTSIYGYIGYNGPGNGTVTVTGSNSVWENADSVTVGYFGTGTLNIENGGKVIAAGTVLGSTYLGHATVNLNGTSSSRGVLSTGILYADAGTVVFNWNGGILQATRTEANFIANFTNSSINIGNQGAYLDTNGFDVGLTTAGVLNGTGGLTKQGIGQLTIAGGNTYAGNTTVSAGILKFATYSQTAGQTLGIGVTSASTDGYGKLEVTGTATFNANADINVEVASVPTLSNGAVLTDVIRAGTLAANGFTVTDNSALFNFEAIQKTNSVDLKVSANSTAGIRDAVNQYGQSSAAGAANVLDGQVNNGGTGDMGTVVTALGQLRNSRDVARATAQTLPVISGNQAIQGALSTFQNLIQNRNGGSAGVTGLSSGDALSNKNGWGKVFGSRAEQDNRSGAAGFKADTWGLALGGDAEVTSGARFGVAYGYAKTSVNGNTDLSGTEQRANIDSHVISAYGSKDIGGNRTFSFQGDVGMNDSKSTRHIDFGGLNRTARADYRTYSAHMGAAIAQLFELNEKTTLTPALRADYTRLKSESYNESGAGALNVNVDSNKTDAFVIGADAYLQHRFSTTSRIDANFGVGYDTINKQGNIVAAYAGAPGQSFVTTGIDHSPWLVRGGIGYSMLAANGTEISFRYDAEGRSDFLNHTASVRAKWAF